MGSFFLFSGCETDVDVNAPDKDITVVFGLIDRLNDQDHYIKINRAFLEEGSAIEFAGQQGITEYGSIDVSIEELQDNGSPFSPPIVYTLSPVINSEKEDGIFYSPDHVLYHFNEILGPATNNRLFRLTVKVQDENDEEKIVTAQTRLVNDVLFAGRLINPTQKVTLANLNEYADEVLFEWRSAVNGVRHQMTIQFHYADVLMNGDTNYHTIDWVLPTVKSPNLDQSTEMKIEVDGEDFYRILASEIPTFDETPNLLRRIPCPWLDFVVDAAGEDVSIYIDVNQPSTGIVQERPAYSNVNNGIGIFSSRSSSKATRKLSKESLDELIEAARPFSENYTGQLGFCDSEQINTGCVLPNCNF